MSNSMKSRAIKDLQDSWCLKILSNCPYQRPKALAFRREFSNITHRVNSHSFSFLTNKCDFSVALGRLFRNFEKSWKALGRSLKFLGRVRVILGILQNASGQFRKLLRPSGDLSGIFEVILLALDELKLTRENALLSNQSEGRNFCARCYNNSSWRVDYLGLYLITCNY